MIPIELLSPAKDLHCGIAAIDHGADAVYIGGPMFGARAAAGNSIEDIQKLITYAHQFHVKVYVALNTILFDNEIPQAVQLAHTLYDIGADALIIQDIGLLECDLPPIPLHASTQLNNRTKEKVKFLELVGFSQVVLARELHIDTIKEIRQNTQVPLEFFVHGAICVCYSGQCYMSAYATGRSGNRGECSQMCRHEYSITGLSADTNKGYLLSPKDLHVSNQIPLLLDAGIQSFKIEGRLKDETYVKNITALFRKKLDTEIALNSSYIRSSHGVETFTFIPQEDKTFSRGFTDYYLTSKQNKIANILSPKSQGEYVGIVNKSKGNSIEITTNLELVNGDGLCFYNENKELTGIRINSCKGALITLNQEINIPIGTKIWRNSSILFTKQLHQSKNCRKIPVDIVLSESYDGYNFTMSDIYGNEVTIERTIKKEVANKPEKISETLLANTQKLGDTIFTSNSITLNFNQIFFIPISEINEARRLACEALLQKRVKSYIRNEKVITKNTNVYPAKEPIDYRLNITNTKAGEFYKRHGITNIEQGYEIRKKQNAPLMTTKYCIRYQLDSCPLQNKAISKAEPIVISDNANSYRVEFDCAKCEMNIYAK